jgi:predicted ATPase
MSRSNGAADDTPKTPTAITLLSVSGFKSIVEEQTLEIRPLTLLAGANSSGKSNMMQPLLLLKQTLETQFDPGPLLLNGPIVRFTSVNQFWPSGGRVPDEFVATVGISDGAKIAIVFTLNKKSKSIDVIENMYSSNGGTFRLSRTPNLEEAIEFLRSLAPTGYSDSIPLNFRIYDPIVRRMAFFLEMVLVPQGGGRSSDSGDFSIPTQLSPQLPRFGRIGQSILEVIHLPGLRGNPERVYPIAAIGSRFPGAFENYAAGLIASWTAESSTKIGALSEDLRTLGLTWKIEATRLNDTQVELRVGRMPRSKQGGAKDLVSIADVGFGVSQTLPVVVALRAAAPGQLVYIEQPGIHLHPRAQVAMARLLVNAAKRGVRVVAETHSSLILLAVQTLVAEGVIEPGLVGLNWFLRDEKTGTTRIKTAELDEAGRFGDWPEDIDEVALEAENRYLSAAEDRLAKG